MSELRELYQALIIDHGRNPRRFGTLPSANRTAKGFNPLCGDELTLYAVVDPDTEVVEVIRFQGSGCAISMASASLMAEALEGKILTDTQKLFELFQRQVTIGHDPTSNNLDHLGKLAVLSGVRNFPSRVKCATLAWHTLQNALHQKNTFITTAK